MADLKVNAGHRVEIEMLRGIAVLTVITSHFNGEILPGGYLGVDMFFVISGYVITRSICSRVHETFGEFLVSFYARRIKRLLPALIVCVVSTSVAISLFNPQPSQSIKTGLAALFGLSNVFLLRLAENYFSAPAAFNTFTHTWSLGVEEQFYAVFPLLIWFSGATMAARGNRATVTVLSVLCALSLAAFIVVDRVSPTTAFYLMPTRFWELASGALVFFWHRHAGSRLGAPRYWLVVACAAILSVMAFLPTEYRIQGTVLTVLITAIVLYAVGDRAESGRIGAAGGIASLGLAYIGNISYSLYLYHWSILSLSRWTIGVHGWAVPFQLALIFILAVLSYRFIEMPLRRAVWFSSSGKVVAAGGAQSIAAAVMLLALIYPLDGRLYTGSIVEMDAATGPSLVGAYQIGNAEASWGGASCVIENDGQVGKRIDLAACTLGDAMSAHRRVLVLGNSFAPTFVQAFDRLVVEDGYAVSIVASLGASPVAEVENRTSWVRANSYYWSDIVPPLIAGLRRNDVVLLISNVSLFSPSRRSEVTERDLSQLAVGLQALSRSLAEGGIRLAMVHGLPFAAEARCTPERAAPQWFAPYGGRCRYFTKAETLARRARLSQVLSDLQGRGLLAVIDLLDIFWARQVCDYYSNGGRFLYRDQSGHPSVEAARLSSGLIRDGLTAAWP